MVNYKKKGTAEIITIGDELLIGQVVNTNASWMAEQLNLAGISLNRIIAIPDDTAALHQSLDDAIPRSEFILLTGGLGPTADDLTKPALCSYFGTEPVFNPDAYSQIEKLFHSRGLSMSERNRKQAYLPANCKPVRNSQGTAPGMWFSHKGSQIISMPGVPFEMKTMLSREILPQLLKTSEKRIILHKTIMTTGMGESWLADRIKSWEEELPEHIHLAYLPQPGIVRLRLSGLGTDRKELEQQIQNQIDKLLSLIPDLVYGFDDAGMEDVVFNMLKATRQSLSTAESCTGGYIAHLITSIPGSSAIFNGAVVAYDNSVKSGLLKVDPALLKHHGAVSRPVVEAMAANARQCMKTDFALATSGIAGPDGGTRDKPVGTVWIALADENGVEAERLQLGDHRERNIRRASLAALNMLRIKLLNL